MSDIKHEHHWIFAGLTADDFEQKFVCEFACGAIKYVNSEQGE